MILTEEKTYIINVTEVDTDAELGLNKKDIMIEYTNLELLHAVLASTMPYGRLSARYRGKRKAELQSRIAMVESVLETRGDQLAKAEQIMYPSAPLFSPETAAHLRISASPSQEAPQPRMLSSHRGSAFCDRVPAPPRSSPQSSSENR